MTRDIKITRIVTTHFDYQIADLALEQDSASIPYTRRAVVCRPVAGC